MAAKIQRFKSTPGLIAQTIREIFLFVFGKMAVLSLMVILKCRQPTGIILLGVSLQKRHYSMKQYSTGAKEWNIGGQWYVFYTWYLYIQLFVNCIQCNMYAVTNFEDDHLTMAGYYIPIFEIVNLQNTSNHIPHYDWLLKIIPGKNQEIP